MLLCTCSYTHALDSSLCHVGLGSRDGVSLIHHRYAASSDVMAAAQRLKRFHMSGGGPDGFESAQARRSVYLKKFGLQIDTAQAYGFLYRVLSWCFLNTRSVTSCVGYMSAPHSFGMIETRCVSFPFFLSPDAVYSHI